MPNLFENESVWSLITTQATYAKQIDMPIDLENGFYLLRLVGENGALTKQICVQH